MKTANLLPIFLALSSLSVNAFSANEPGRGEFRSRVDGVRAEMFAEFKAIESFSHKERMRILQEADACIQAAMDRDKYRTCEQRENQARDQVKEQVKARHDALRAKAEGFKQGILSWRQ